MGKNIKHQIQMYLKHVRFVLSKQSIARNSNDWDPLKLYFIDPERVVYVTPVTPYVDYIRHETHGVNHPHSAINRGSFKKNRIGRIFSEDWDVKTLLFNELEEFISLKDFLNGTETWENTPFAQRTIRWIESGNRYREFTDVDDYLTYQPERIQKLCNSIEKNGVKRISYSRYDRKVFDEITVNIGRDNDIFFNNRGHHRLSIAKIVGCEKVPVLINTRYNNIILS
jgi:hypothetical protein